MIIYTCHKEIKYNKFQDCIDKNTILMYDTDNKRKENDNN